MADEVFGEELAVFYDQRLMISVRGAVCLWPVLIFVCSFTLWSSLAEAQQPAASGKNQIEHNKAVANKTLAKKEAQPSQQATYDEQNSAAQMVHRVMLISNGRGKVVSMGGWSAPLSPHRTLVLMKEGWNELRVSGAGYLEQTYRVFIDARRAAEPIFLALRPVAADAPAELPLELPPFLDKINDAAKHPRDLYISQQRQDQEEEVEEQRIRFLAQVPSSCAKLNLTIPPTQRSYSLCAYKNLAEEVFRVGPLFRGLSSQASSAAHYTSLQFQRNLASSRFSGRLALLAENLHRMTWRSALGFEAASFVALLQGQCERVLQLWQEYFQWRRSSAALTTHLAMCYESAGHDAQALKVLQYGQNAISAMDPEQAALYYHLARVQMKNSVAAAQPTLQRCTEVFPWYYPCYARKADVAVARGSHSQRESALASFKQATEEHYAASLRLAVDHMRKGEYSLTSKALEPLKFQEISFSVQFLKALLQRKTSKSMTKEQKQKLHPYLPPPQMRVVHPASAQAVMELVEHAYDPQLYELALHVMLRESTEEHSSYVEKITRHYFERDQCSQMLSVHLPEFTGDDAELYIIAMERRAQCLMKLKKFEEAEKTLAKMKKIMPTDWRSRYGMGELYLLKKEKFTAINYFRSARQLAPPEDIISLINKKIKEIEASMSAY